MTSDNIKSGLMLAAVGVVGLIAWTVYKKAGAVGDAVKKAAPYLNPASDQNLIYSGINAVGGAITQDDYWTLGGAVYDAVQVVGPAINPASDQNLIYSGVNAIGSAATGSNDWSLGGAIYDWTHPDEYASTTINTAAQTDAKRISTGGASGSY